MAGPDKLPASHIPVKMARLILLWPLALELRPLPEDSQDLARAVHAAARRIEHPAGTGQPGWIREYDPINHIAPPRDPRERRTWEQEVYAEGVYFHPFVQSFLFARQGTGDDPSQPFWLFRRHDIRHVEIGMSASRTMRFDVERANLYLFRTGAAMVVTEIATPTPSGLTLADVEDLQDSFRRSYHPYFKPDGDASHLVARSVSWIRDADGQAVADRHDLAGPGAQTGRDDVAAYCRHPQGGGKRVPPVFPHWRALLADALPLAGYAAPAAGEGVWHHVVDERMPTVLYVSVTADQDRGESFYYDRIRRSDLVRLCFADQAADGVAPNDDPHAFPPEQYPGDEDFFRDFEAKHVYARFARSGTTYLLSGYALVAIGCGAGDFDDYIQVHMRRHYFQMALLAHFESAALLAFSAQLSRAVEALERGSTPSAQGRADGQSNMAQLLAFRARMQAIQDAFLQFVNRFRFTGVSNQLQAREMFDRLRDTLGLDRLFEEVRTDIERANEYLFNLAQADAAEEAGQAAAAATRLSRIAAIGVIGGLVTSFLGMNVLAQPSLFAFLPGACDGQLTLAHHFGLACLVAAVGCLGGATVFRQMLSREAVPGSDTPDLNGALHPADRRLIAKIRSAGWALSALGLLGLAVAAVSHPCWPSWS